MERSDTNASALINFSWRPMEKLALQTVRPVSTDVVEKITDVSHSTGNVMERKIVLMEQTSLVRVKRGSVNLDSSSAPIIIVRRPLRSAMGWMIAVTDRMRRTAIYPALRMNLNAILLVDVSWELGNVMEITTVATVPTKIRPFVTRELAILRRSLRARTGGVSRNRGIVIRIMIAGMDRMNLPTFAGRGIVRPDGGGVPNGATTDAYPSGSSVTAKTTVEMVINP